MTTAAVEGAEVCRRRIGHGVYRELAGLQLICAVSIIRTQTISTSCRAAGVSEARIDSVSCLATQREIVRRIVFIQNGNHGESHCCGGDARICYKNLAYHIRVVQRVSCEYDVRTSQDCRLLVKRIKSDFELLRARSSDRALLRGVRIIAGCESGAGLIVYGFDNKVLINRANNRVGV